MGGTVVQGQALGRQKSEEAKENHHRVPIPICPSRCGTTCRTHLAFDVAVDFEKKEAAKGGIGLKATK
jgi:hypothetical protein